MRNGRYRPNKKNGGIVPAVLDNRVLATPIKCNECIECHKQKRNGWRVRINEEIKTDKRGFFITLTFTDDAIKELATTKEARGLSGYALDNKIAKIAVRRFYERHRKDYGKTIKHWLVTEIGGNNTERIHLHGIIWTDLTPLEIQRYWGYGNIRDGKYKPTNRKQSYLNERTINYITKYLTKKDPKHKYYKSEVLSSNGIGKEYANSHAAKMQKYIRGRTQEAYITRGGHEIQMPTYLRNKIYSDEEREKLWIEKLDKGYMYILGRRINVKTNEQEYKEFLREAQKRNKKLGYGNGDFNWQEKVNEEHRRILKQKENWYEGIEWNERAKTMWQPKEPHTQ